MKRPRLIIKQIMNCNESTEGETIEQQVERLVSNNEPVEGQEPLIYTERKEGIRAETNIRTDRFEIAIDAMDKVAASYQARRAERAEKLELERAEGSSDRQEGSRSGQSMDDTKG